jgi:hypothetical protein
MALYRTDDDVHSLVYRWHGPAFQGFWSLFRFKGRPLTEWFFCVALFVVAWTWGEPLVALVASYEANPLSKMAYDRFIDPDRDPRYMARCWVMHVWRQAWSRGPVDRVVAVVGFGWWQVFTRVLSAVGVPWWLGWPAATVAAVWTARRLVARFQSPERAWRYRLVRAARAGRFDAIEVSP